MQEIAFLEALACIENKLNIVIPAQAGIHIPESNVIKKKEGIGLAAIILLNKHFHWNDSILDNSYPTPTFLLS